MMKKFYGKVRRAVGFTMAEVLIVVAILAILLTLAMPNVLAYFRELRLTELDDNARTVFLAAQNRLTALVNSGEADKLGGTAVTKFPGEGGGSATPGTPVGLYMLSSGEPGMSLLIPAGSIEPSLASGYYVIYYFPGSGAVYSVWYCDRDDDREEYTKYTDKGDRLKQSVLVGYYGDSDGNIIDRAEVGQLPIPKVTLRNAEELRLDIEMPFTGTEIDPTKTTLEVKITGANGGEKTLLKANFGAGDPAHKTAIVLDTLKEEYTWPAVGAVSLDGITIYGGPFKNLGTGITPGEDITLTVTVSYTPGADEKQFTSQTVSVKGNSLFAFVNEKDGARTANIAYGRHLQNLNNDATGITAANQIRDIDFEDTKNVKDIESWKETYFNKIFEPISNDKLKSYNGNKLKIRHMTAGASGDNSGLFADVKDGVKFENIVLVDCKAGDDAVAHVGTLAGTAESAVFSGCEVYVEDRMVDNTVSTIPLLTGQTVGGLVGTVNGGCEFKYSFASTVESGKTVGGLVGEVKTSGGTATTFTSCYAAGYLKYLTSGSGAKEGGYIAGLVGNAESTTISNCYTAGVITGELLHDMGNSPNNAAVAGIANGNAAVSTGSTAYAAVIYIDTSSFKNGKVKVIPIVENAGDNCFYVNQSNVEFVNVGQAVKKTASGMMMDATHFTAANGWYKLKDSTSNPGYTVFPYNQTDSSKTLTSPYPYPELKDESEKPILHHGDWPRFYTAGYFYWEKEGTDYHFYLVEWESEDSKTWHNIGGTDNNAVTLIDTLCYDYHDLKADVPNVEESGYGYFTSGFDTAPKVTAANGTVYDNNAALSAALEKEVGTSVTATAYTTVNMSDGSGTYATWSFNGGHNIPTAYLCSDFAVSIAVNGNGATYTKEGNKYPTAKRGITNSANNFGTASYPYVVRSIAQLDNVDKQAAYMGSSKNFEQQHDLNGDGKPAFHMIGPGINEFLGHFNGLGYRILDLNIVGQDNHAALFAYLGGGAIVENVIMYSPKGTATVTVEYDDTLTGSHSVNAAGIAADGWTATSTPPTIQNCIVAGYTIQAIGNGYAESGGNSSTAGHYIGGIAAWYQGNIRNCEAVVTLKSAAGDISRVANKYKNVFTGGIIGGTNKATIENCYAGGIIYKATSSNPTDDSNIGQFSGGILGNIDYANTASATIRGCYSYINMLQLKSGKGERRYFLNGADSQTDENYIQAIGPAYNGDGNYGSNHYWSKVLPNNRAGNGATANTYGELCQFSSWGPQYSFQNATYVNGVESNAFVLGSIVNVPISYNNETGERTTAYVHYGWYPKNDSDRYPAP